MAVLRLAKVVSNLPSILQPDTLYLVRTGTGFEIYVSDTTGSIAYSNNKDALAGNGLFFSNNSLNVGGTHGRISVGTDNIDIDVNYSGQESITTVGTLTSGSLGQGFTTISVERGGTGATKFTSRGILFGNDVGAIGVTSASATDGCFLAEDSTGNPYWTEVIDGGTF